ncbi:MAG: hypothetical protein ACRDB0_05010, partial [Paraclostridium sp.]
TNLFKMISKLKEEFKQQQLSDEVLETWIIKHKELTSYQLYVKYYIVDMMLTSKTEDKIHLDTSYTITPSGTSGIYIRNLNVFNRKTTIHGKLIDLVTYDYNTETDTGEAFLINKDNEFKKVYYYVLYNDDSEYIEILGGN